MLELNALRRTNNRIFGWCISVLISVIELLTAQSRLIFVMRLLAQRSTLGLTRIPINLNENCEYPSNHPVFRPRGYSKTCSHICERYLQDILRYTSPEKHCL